MGNIHIDYDYNDLNITDGKITYLENQIRTFNKTNKTHIEKIFKNKKIEEKNIHFLIKKEEGKFKIEKSKEEIDDEKDYVINWYFKGKDKINNTKCQLIFFNIGGILGADGLLYSICIFYYCFMKIPIYNEVPKEKIREKINDGLLNIEKGNIEKLKAIFNVELDNEMLNNLKICEELFKTLFGDNIDEIICDKICNPYLKIILRPFTKISKFTVIVFNYLANKIRKGNPKFVETKNRINREKIIEKIFNNLKVDFFKKYNLYIIACDDNTIKGKNLGATFMGDYCKKIN